MDAGSSVNSGKKPDTWIRIITQGLFHILMCFKNRSSLDMFIYRTRAVY